MGEIRRARNDRTDRGGTARREIRGGEATAGTEGCRGWNRSTRGRRVRNRSVNPKPVRNATRGSSANVDRAATPPSANPMRWRGARGGLLCRFRSLDTRRDRRGARTRSVRGSVNPSRATTLAGRTNERRGFVPSRARLFACRRARWGFVSSSSALLTARRAPRGRAPGRGGGGVRDGVVVAPRHAGARWTRAAARRPTRARWARWARALRSRCRTPRRGAREERARERDPRRRGGILRTLRPPPPRPANDPRAARGGAEVGGSSSVPPPREASSSSSGAAPSAGVHRRRVLVARRRDTDQRRESAPPASSSSASTAAAPTPLAPLPSLGEREAEYAKARERIFGAVSAEDALSGDDAPASSSDVVGSGDFVGSPRGGAPLGCSRDEKEKERRSGRRSRSGSPRPLSTGPGPGGRAVARDYRADMHDPDFDRGATRFFAPAHPDHGGPGVRDRFGRAGDPRGILRGFGVLRVRVRARGRGAGGGGRSARGGGAGAGAEASVGRASSRRRRKAPSLRGRAT